jgi:hypothetical protein
MAHKEPPWLTAVFKVVGLIMIVALLAFTFLVVLYWPFFLLLTIAAGAGYWYVHSPALKERRAKQQISFLLQRLAALDTDLFPSVDDFSENLIAELIRGRAHIPTSQILTSIINIAEDLYISENFKLSAISEPPPLLDSIDGARYSEKVQRQYRKLVDDSAFQAFRTILLTTFKEFIKSLPPIATQTNQTVLDQVEGRTSSSSFEIPLIDILTDTGQRVDDLILPFYSEKARTHQLFLELRNQLDRNLHELSGVPFTVENFSSPKLIIPTDYKGDDLISSYLHHTPLKNIFSATVPLTIPEQTRFAHTHIVGGTNHGKTQTIQHLILSDLSSKIPPSLVIIDSQGDMLQKLSHLALFDGPLRDKLIYIDPTDIEYAPALNMFDVSRLSNLKPVEREQALNGIIELYEYVFASLLRAELTQKQNVLFRYTLRLMLAVPKATILDLVKFLHTPDSYMQYAEALPETAREFFRTEFFDKSFTQTKQQIRRRIFGVLENDTFRRMFSTPENRMRMDEALNSGKIILVNTAKDHLKKDSSSLLGRYFIALTLQAALERASLPEHTRRPAFLYIDEAAEYFDDNVDELLNQARKYKVGVVLSHQYMDQLTQTLRGSIAANTSIKLAGGVSDKDARNLAPEMRCKPEFITNQQRTNHGTSFACYIRNFTPQAVSISVPFGALEKEPTMSDGAFSRFIVKNRARLSPTKQPSDNQNFADLTTVSNQNPDEQGPGSSPPQHRSSPAQDGDDWNG